MSNVVIDLRQVAFSIGQSHPVSAAICSAAADFIETQHASIRELKQRLAVEEVHSEKYMTENKRLRKELNRWHDWHSRTSLEVPNQGEE